MQVHWPGWALAVGVDRKVTDSWLVSGGPWCIKHTRVFMLGVGVLCSPGSKKGRVPPIPPHAHLVALGTSCTAQRVALALTPSCLGGQCWAVSSEEQVPGPHELVAGWQDGRKVAW